MVGATAALFGGTNWAGMDGYIKRKIFLMKINGFRGYFIHIFRWGQKNGWVLFNLIQNHQVSRNPLNSDQHSH